MQRIYFCDFFSTVKGCYFTSHTLFQKLRNLVGVQISTIKTKMRVSIAFQEILPGINASNPAKPNYMLQVVNGIKTEHALITLPQCLVEVAVLTTSVKNQVIISSDSDFLHFQYRVFVRLHIFCNNGNMIVNMVISMVHC